jgi:undecaprenyl pyrophosphate phosphatase UppP
VLPNAMLLIAATTPSAVIGSFIRHEICRMLAQRGTVQFALIVTDVIAAAASQK